MPFQRQLHVDQLLSNVSLKYSNSELIAREVFPEVMVKKDSDLYRIYDREFRIPETMKANKGSAHQFYWEVSTASYVLEDHALKDYVSDDDIDNYDAADLRADTVERLTEAINRRLELSVANLFTTTNWSLNVSLAAANAFNASPSAGSDPIVVFDTGATEVLGNCGVKPNYAIMPRASYVGFKNHSEVRDRVKYVSSDMTKEMAAGLLDIEKVLTPAAIYDSAAKGLGPTIVNIWGDSSFIGYKAPRPGPLQPSAGYIFRKDVPLVRRWRDEERNAEAIEVRLKFQARVVASLAGFLIKDSE